MIPKFEVGQILFNRNTKESGMVQKIYKSDGKPKYEVTIQVYHGFSMGSHVSDWTEDVLETRSN
jgi:hypothetical protein